MALETKLYHKMAQQLVMTPQLQQAIKMLQLSKLELVEAIQQELEENPVLEEDLESREEGIEQEAPSEQLAEEDWDSYLSGSNFDKPASSYIDNREEATFESFTPQKTTLSEHLLWQLRMSDIDKRWQQIGEALIGSINDDGYLEVPVQEMADSLGYDKEEIEKILKTIQDFDPQTGQGTGFKFEAYDGQALLACIRRALATYRDAKAWKKVQANGMAKDFSWKASAAEYAQLYETARKSRNLRAAGTSN